MRSLAAEITREKMFERLHDELPYQTTVETESWKDLPDGSARIEQTIYRHAATATRRSCIGEGGRTLKAIGTAARKEIAEANETQGAPVPVRQGARELARRPRALSGDGAGVSEEVARGLVDLHCEQRSDEGAKASTLLQQRSHGTASRRPGRACPAIYVVTSAGLSEQFSACPSPRGVDARDKPGHDGRGVEPAASCAWLFPPRHGNGDRAVLAGLVPASTS